MFKDISFRDDIPIPAQIRDYIKELILKGMLQKNEKLPSTRELSLIMGVGRNSILRAYEDLEDDGFIHIEGNRGAFVLDVHITKKDDWHINWENRLNELVPIAEKYDIIKNTVKADKKVISFRGISPDRDLLDVEGIKRAFLNIISKEGSGILNYGYARGYKPLIDYLLKYMENKGVDTGGKDILITNGFTEGFDIVLSALTKPGSRIICENPTHNTAIKIMTLHGLDIIGVEMDDDGINIDSLKQKLTDDICAGYLVPSYHNPTGIVMRPEKRLQVYETFRERNVPIIEDGFNEELRYSGAHISPIAAFCGRGNGVIYIGSFSKILFPGMRVGWVLADEQFISSIESIKKSRNIHTSFLDQAILYQYLWEGNFEKCIRRSRKVYGERYNLALRCAKQYIPNCSITGDGGMYIFLKLGEDVDTRVLLDYCYNRGVIFMPGDIFYIGRGGSSTMRLGFANVRDEDIEKGIRIIGEALQDMKGRV